MFVNHPDNPMESFGVIDSNEPKLHYDIKQIGSKDV